MPKKIESREIRFYPGEIMKKVEEDLVKGPRENAEAQGKLVRAGVIKPEQEVTLPPSLTLALKERTETTY